MTIRHLRIFITVYDERNMTAAAAKLFMTQPSVSQAIKELENFYRVILFERLSRKLYATSSGEKLYQYACHIINLFDELDDVLKQDAYRKKLVVGANYTVGVVLIHQYIAQFKSLYPDSDVMVMVNKSSILLDKLRKNELDLALVEEVPNESDLVGDFFYNDHIVIVACPDHPLLNKTAITGQDIVNENLLLREKGAGVRNLFEQLMNQLGFAIKPYWESTSTTALINAAINKIGIAVLPYHLVKEYIASGSLKEIEVKGINFNRKLMVVYHKNKFLTSAMQDFIKICHEA
ncbi:LysR family transcriptional regulator [Desulfitobacterium chlororespirans]|uniref:DNA-binding transcriptional regulator, LysR family n=1 Tax=Desulfitobacterium chlororespirans DSM 11544 TaxID=1121395 RepID=A0A1M7TGG9_9FIRM|nr:LysR family transcriptional regulator [Desulfitobacterium chlororespirans]SHN69743.1 DNA-binding transcriptional regulator, LysR family [Desulfitobacterium chlororespirans DSM 11544]